jgi:hypothetical protein
MFNNYCPKKKHRNEKINLCCRVEFIFYLDWMVNIWSDIALQARLWESIPRNAMLHNTCYYLNYKNLVDLKVNKSAFLIYDIEDI